jgi:salicylate hydroxylase
VELERERKSSILIRCSLRNGYTGEIFPEPNSSAVPTKRGPTRVPRTRLHAALGAQVPNGIIQFAKKLVSLQNLESRGVRLAFQDGTETTADLVVGADGIRSVGFPFHLINMW